MPDPLHKEVAEILGWLDGVKPALIVPICDSGSEIITLESWESELDDVREKFAALRAGGWIAVDSAVKMDALIAFMVANPPSSEAFKAETSTGDC